MNIYKFILLFFLLPSLWVCAQKNRNKSRKQVDGYMIAKKTAKIEDHDYDKLHRNNVDKEKYSKLECPDKSNRKDDDPDILTFTSNVKANIIRSTNSVHFDVVELDDVHLDIPAFKLFKNNMTDFTADGEHQFNEILHKIDIFLGKNHEGKGVTLKIMGSASQIPTSFDPAIAGNNINADGSSITGKTSIGNNKKLAKARADELAKKIKNVFPSIKIQTPALEEIELGPTKWNNDCQLKLNEASFKGDKEAIRKIYEPFQKDQWVKVESKDKTTKVIQPESIKMYMVSTTPSLKTMINGQEASVRTIFIVSKKTFDAIGDHRVFGTVEERDKYLHKLGLKVYSLEKNGATRYYLLSGQEELHAFHIEEYNQKIYALYHLDIVDNMDEQILEQKIIKDLKASQ